MYEAAPFPEGDTLAILAVGTNPEFQRRGIAGALIREGLSRSVKLGMHHAVLACKEEKFNFYSNLGFHEIGKSKSEHGNAIWYDMAMELKKEEELHLILMLLMRSYLLKKKLLKFIIIS